MTMPAPPPERASEPIVYHPDDGRPGAFVGMSFLLDLWALHVGEWLEPLEIRETFPIGYDQSTPYRRAVAAHLRAQEFEPSRPCEAVPIGTRYGYGFFYLPDPSPAA